MVKVKVNILVDSTHRVGPSTRRFSYRVGTFRSPLAELLLELVEFLSLHNTVGTFHPQLAESFLELIEFLNLHNIVGTFQS